MTRPEFAYAQARLQARHGALPDARTWLALEASHTAGHYLALARAGPMARWTKGLEEGGDAHRTERQLRVLWRSYVDEVARWQPDRWQAATRWFGSLPELPLGRDPPQAKPAAGWLAEWQRLMPGRALSPRPLYRAAELLMPRLRSAGGTRAAGSEPVRAALLKLFRRHGGSPVAVFAHLALVALDVERLRGGIVARTLLPPASATREA